MQWFLGISSMQQDILLLQNDVLQKKFFEVFEVEGRGRGRDSRSKLTVPHKMGYRWNRLDLRNSKMSTEKSGTVSVLF